MGSCSSGGPNKVPGMCLVKTNEKDEDCARPISTGDHSVPNCSWRDQLDKPISIAPVLSDGRGANSMKERCSGITVNSRQFARVWDPMTCEMSDGRNAQGAFSLDTLSDAQESVMDGRFVRSGNDISEGAFGDCSGASTMKRVASDTMPSTSTARPIGPTDLYKRYEGYEKRKAAAVRDLYRWSGEYGSCIVAPPNKTVFDALVSPCGRADYSLESGWFMHSDDQKTASLTQRNQRPTLRRQSDGYTSDELSGSTTDTALSDDLSSDLLFSCGPSRTSSCGAQSSPSSRRQPDKRCYSVSVGSPCGRTLPRAAVSAAPPDVGGTVDRAERSLSSTRVANGTTDDAA